MRPFILIMNSRQRKGNGTAGYFSGEKTTAGKPAAACGKRTFESAYGMLRYTVGDLCITHAYLEDCERVNETDRQIFRRLKSAEGTEEELKRALVIIMRMMKAYYGKDVILLIDEYDVPLAKASDNGYYREMLSIIRTFLGMAWKTNPALKRAVITGCLRIAKESMFTGANNFISSSIQSRAYERYFGFSQEEVKKLLADAELSDCLAEMKAWYDGYLFGAQEVYCPWDVINHVRLLQIDREGKPENYWKDTSHNGIIRSFIDLPGIDVTEKFERFLAEYSIQERISEDLTYDLVHSSEENLWSILYLTGYLTRAGHLPEGELPEEGKTALRIPNEEVKTVFADTVAKWFADTVTVMDRRELLFAWWHGEAEKLTELVTDILFDTISYYDYKEDYYHAFAASLFTGAGYEVSSNREQGTGRVDILVKERKKRRAITMEVKRSKQEKDMEQDCREALEQIERRQYDKTRLKGYRTILKYGAAFFEKQCLIKTA